MVWFSSKRQFITAYNVARVIRILSGEYSTIRMVLFAVTPVRKQGLKNLNMSWEVCMRRDGKMACMWPYSLEKELSVMMMLVTAFGLIPGREVIVFVFRMMWPSSRLTISYRTTNSGISRCRRLIVIILWDFFDLIGREKCFASGSCRHGRKLCTISSKMSSSL